MVAAVAAGLASTLPQAVPVRTVRVERGLRYGGSAAQPLHLDAFVPRASRRLPGLILVHGGGWTAGSKESFDPTAARLAQLGLVTLSIDYRLAPAARSPAAVDDVVAAILWIRRHSARLGVDPARIGLLGASAGGNLVLAAALRRVGLVRAVVAWSAPTDLAGFVHESRNGYALRSIRAFLGCPASACAARYRAASPVDLVRRGDPPIFLANSLREIVPVVQARTMAARLAHAGVPHELLLMPGSRHATEYERAAWQPTLRFLHRYLAWTG